MSVQTLKFDCNDLVPKTVPAWFDSVAAGDITADITKTIIAPFNGRIDNLNDAFLRLTTTGADATDPLSVALDVTINGTSIFTTTPAIGPTATNGSTTLAAGTGITLGVLKALALRTFAKGDLIAIVIDVTRTTPDTEAANAYAQVGLTPNTVFDPDHTVNVS